MDDSANLPFSGSKTVDDSTKPGSYHDLDYWEPHEANPRDEDEEKRSGGEIGHYADELDEMEAESDEPVVPDEEEAITQAEDMIVTLKGGEQVPLEELKLGYMRERDYRHRIQDLTTQGLALESMSSRVAATASAIAELLAGQIPDEPPEELRLNDPQAYQRQWTVHMAGLEQLARVMALADERTGIAAELQSAAAEERLAAENAKLLEAFPQTGHDEGRHAFFTDAFETARELGFYDEEVREVVDHRVFKLAHYARLGLNAERARAKALQKVSAAPIPAPLMKAKTQGQQQRRESRDAMRRLTQSGSIRDAMAVNFE